MKILVIDDDRTVCTSLSLLLRKRGNFNVETIHHPSVALETIDRFEPQLILLDMNFTIDTTGKQGLHLLGLIRKQTPHISVILMTGWATVQLAVQGMKIGARDFIAKPWDNKSLIDSIKSILELHHKVENRQFRSSNEDVSDLSSSNGIIGESEEMVEILDMVKRVANTEASVLITGESGTGKELIAEAIHQRSKRKEQSFVKVNLGGISSDLFESEMFGHVKGSFTGAYADREGRFATANRGTIFLDEIGELPLQNQVKMLRVLQERTFEKLGSSTPLKTDVRVISATNKNLQQMAIDGSFREDLFYRINLLHIQLPPLRERRTDIPILTKYFLQKVALLYNTDRPYLNDATLHWLSQQEYKGNIRQLKNIVERAFLLNIDKVELSKKEFASAFEMASPVSTLSSPMNLQEMEVNTIKKALAKYDHSISEASRALGLTRSSLYRRLDKYNIPYESKF